MRILQIFCLGLLLSFWFATNSFAHRIDESYVYFQVTDDALTGRFEAQTKDLDQALGLDDNGDGSTSEAELTTHSARIFEFFAERLDIQSAGKRTPIVAGPISVLDTPLGTFAQISFTVEGLGATPETVTIGYQPMADVLDRTHPGFILIESNTRTGQENNESNVSLIFNPGDAPKELSLIGDPWYKILVDFVVEGVWHIWIGFDHVVFLVLLLLTSIMRAENGRWVPLNSFRAALWNTVKIVTVFTISHSVTLSLAAFGIVQLPVGLVEAVIAVSIIAVAVMHFFPNLHRYLLVTVFAFGLFHGFGFANVLAPLGLNPASQLLGIAAFNIGVELGQIAIVLVVFPILWLVRRWRFYPPVAFQFGSCVVILVAGIWLLERTTDFEWNTRATIHSITGIQL